MLFIPAGILEKGGTKLRLESETRCQIITLLSEKTSSKWAPYVVGKKDTASKLLEESEEMGGYLRQRPAPVRSALG